MYRRTFLVMAAVACSPRAVRAQQPGSPRRIAILSPTTAPPPSSDQHAIVLREIGYVEERNVIIERYYADGKPDRLPSLAQELVRRAPDVIIAVSTGAVKACQETTRTIPIVMGFAGDPVARGFVATLAHPGGNITGVAYSPDDASLAPKRLELIKEAVPRVGRIAVLTTSEVMQAFLGGAHKAATSLGVKLVVVELREGDYTRAFAAIAGGRAGALVVASSPILLRDRKRIIDLAATHRLPAIYEWREFVADGGLMSYGGSLLAMNRRVASYVDRILKGASPADLPVEQPATLALTINAKTARALGLAIPPSLMARADEIIE